MSETIYILDQNGTRDDLISWEYIKFEKRPHSITFSKNWKFLKFLKNFQCRKRKDFEKSNSSYSGNGDYISCKAKLHNICDKKLWALKLEASVTGKKKRKKPLKSF